MAPKGIRRAILGGVTSIEHGTYMDDEYIRLIKQYGTWYVPAIIAGKAVADSARKGYYPPIIAAKAIAFGDQIQNTFAKAYKAGVKLLLALMQVHLMVFADLLKFNFVY